MCRGRAVRNVATVTANGSHNRLSALDASFLAVESEVAHMHVGWVALFDPPEDRPTPAFHALRMHIAARLQRAPRYRQKLRFVPLGIHDPVWVDDDEFDLSRHLFRSQTTDLDLLVEEIFSAPLDRDRPLWEIWIADQLPDGRIGVIGKVHHCMVDGIAAVELASLFMDPDPHAPVGEPDDWRPAPPPRRVPLFAGSARDRIFEELSLARIPAGLVRSPRRVPDLVKTSVRAARSLAHTITPPAPASRLNESSSPLRALARVRRPMSDLKATKERHGVTLNDVVLAASAGAMRRYLQEHHDATTHLKAMVPVNVRGDGAAGDLGNEVSFLFVALPCDEPDPVRRLEDIHAVMSDRKAAREPRGSQAVLDALRFAPHPVQHALSRAVAAPRTYNVVVSNIPGPPGALYMMGCPLREAYPIVPLSDHHGVAIGFTGVAGDGCFGIYADRGSVADLARLARDLEESIDELVASVPAGAVPEL